MNQCAEPVVAGQTEARDAPAPKVPEANLATLFDDALEWQTAGIRCAEDAPDAAAGYAGDRNLFFLEDLEDAQVRIAAREPASQGQTDSRTEVWVVCKKSSRVRSECHEKEALKGVEA